MITKDKILARDAVRAIIGIISFGRMIQSYRLGQEYTQVQFAEMLEISKQDLCNIEKGRKLVSVERAIQFAKALGMSEIVFAEYALQDQLTKAGIKRKVYIENHR
jgi:transcriptional regulator with XRE-family HTH domain